MDIRKRFERILAIFFQLQSRPVVKAQELADRFDVSLRTIYRDIKSLEEAGVPVSGEAGIGYSLMRGYKIPPTLFTQEEALSFAAAEKLMEQYFDKGLRQHFKAALDKMKAILRPTDKENLALLGDQVSMKPLSVHIFNQNAPTALATILDSITFQKQVVIEYKKRGAADSEARIIEPIGVFQDYNFWYIVAYCLTRKAVRQFRLDRIYHIRQKDERFTLRHQRLEYYLDKLKPPETQAIVIAVKKTDAAYLHWERQRMGFQKEYPEGDYMIMHFQYHNMEQHFARWLLQYADMVRILAPQQLQSAVQHILDTAFRNWENQPVTGSGEE